MSQLTQLPLRIGVRPSSSFQYSSQPRLPWISACSFSTTASLEMKAKGGEKRRRRKAKGRIDPYHKAQAAQLKAANEARQEVLKKERADALGDAVRSKPTPFIQSIRHKFTEESEAPEDLAQYANYNSTSKEVTEVADKAKFLAEPLEAAIQRYADDGTTLLTPEKVIQLHDQRRVDWENNDTIAREALKRITALSNSSSQGRTHVDIKRCIEEFGRHKTDQILPPRPQGPAQLETPSPEHQRLRAGPDTGSSEVQIAILTTKIDKLADMVDKYGHKDKHNKRNLRVLVHKRQKLLAYLRRRERGGPRWTHLMEKLGLSDGAWKGEISM